MLAKLFTYSLFGPQPEVFPGPQSERDDTDVGRPHVVGRVSHDLKKGLGVEVRHPLPFRLHGEYLAEGAGRFVVLVSERLAEELR